MTAWLLTWVWHGAALVAVVAVMLQLVPRLNAATRYAIWFGVLVAIAWPGWMSAAPAVDQPIYVPSAPDPALTVFIGIWAAISLLTLVRIVPSLHAIHSLRARCRAFPSHLEARLPMWLEARDRGRKTELKICDAIPGATVLGFHRPCIALPSALVDALTPTELDQIVLHEYAHVQRRDDWSRLAQALALCALWIHPAAHAVSRALNRQREMACDEWVVARTGLPKAYAKCLAHAAEVRGQLRGSPALLSAFLGTRHELVRRVDRLLTLHRRPRRSVSLPGLGAAIAAIMIVSMQLQSVRFAEIAEFVLPHVGAPMVRLASATVRL
ncbi:MAG TPA: M56 family metallopeptidase, partial [Vicinamibacterales bacterium]|nr:M56 family metallopeptidase [Vicinamibacterales bacterium]